MSFRSIELGALVVAVGACAWIATACGGDGDTTGTGGGNNSGGSSGSGGSSSGGTSSGGSGQGGSSTGGGGGAAGTCATTTASCLDQPCCTGLNCCSGNPIPANEAICLTECPISDRNLKRDITAVDTADVLERVARLPISTWSYKSDATGARHIGPMAQDFMATFAVGANDRTILQVDGDGVALASIQALRARLIALETQNAKLEQALKRLETKLESGRLRASR